MSVKLNKQAKNWTDAELVSWAKGDLSPTGAASVRTIGVECVKRFGLEETTDTDLIKQQVLAEQPAEGGEDTPLAVVVEPPADETEGEAVVTEGENTPPAPVVEPPVVVEPEVIEDPVPVVLEVILPPAVIVTQVSQLDMKMGIIEQNLATYASVMAINSPVTAEDGAMQQTLLYGTIKQVLGLTGSDFTNQFTRLLDFVAAHRNTMFSERYAYRFFEQVRVNQHERKNFERILNLLIATSVPGTRQMGLRQIDLQRTLEGIHNGDVQQRITEYYQV